MTLRKAAAETQPQQKSVESKLALVPKGTKLKGHMPVVSQLRLARIQQIQAEIAYLQNELVKEWNTVRGDLLHGAIVEKGPLRAWIKCILRLGRAKTIETPGRKVSKTLMVR